MSTFQCDFAKWQILQEKHKVKIWIYARKYKKTVNKWKRFSVFNQYWVIFSGSYFVSDCSRKILLALLCDWQIRYIQSMSELKLHCGLDAFPMVVDQKSNFCCPPSWSVSRDHSQWVKNVNLWSNWHIPSLRPWMLTVKTLWNWGSLFATIFKIVRHFMVVVLVW